MDLEDLAHVTLVAGAPRSGKTEFALDMLIAAMKRYGDANAVMTVSGRQIADMLGDRAIRELSAVSQARPVTTLSAVAFRLLTAARSAQGKPLPKLLNGAEQDVIIRKVLASHVEHRQHGDECATCDLLRVYFAVSEWSGLVADDSTDAFANQLRDMLARMNEIGAKPELENMLIARAASRNGELDARRERLRTQWRLAFALREEYNAAIRAAYSGEYRLDASQLMIDATEAVSDIRDADIPNMLIVDDFLRPCIIAGRACCWWAIPTKPCRRSADRIRNICSTRRSRAWERDWSASKTCMPHAKMMARKPSETRRTGKTCMTTIARLSRLA